MAAWRGVLCPCLGFAEGCMFHVPHSIPAGPPRERCVCPWHGSRSEPSPGEEGELGSVRTSLVDQSLSREGRQELP